MREYEDAMLDVQGRHVRVHDESTMGICKDVHYESRLFGNKFKYGIDMSRGKPNQWVCKVFP
jgi:hypothetical protein